MHDLSSGKDYYKWFTLQMIVGENEKLSVLDIWTFRSLAAGTRNVFQNAQRKKIVSEQELFSELTEPRSNSNLKLSFLVTLIWQCISN